MKLNPANISKLQKFIEAKTLQNATQTTEPILQSFFVGVVKNNKDPHNSNRVQVRIPLLDDPFYFGTSESEGDKNLPYCFGLSTRFIETPDENSVVFVQLMDLSDPYVGRIYYSVIPEISSRDLFDASNLVNDNQKQPLTNINKLTGYVFDYLRNFRSSLTQSNKKNTVGIRGKGKNKVLLNASNLILVQNEGTQKESSIELSEDIEMKVSRGKKIKLTDGTSSEKIVYAKDVLNYFDEITKTFDMVNAAFKPIEVLLPGYSAAIAPLITQTAVLRAKILEIKTKGLSKTVIIN